MRVLAAGGAAVAAAVTLQGSAAGAASPHSDSTEGSHEATTMTFDVKFSPFNYIDLAKPGPSAADEVVFHDKLFKNGLQVGDDLGSCILVDPNGLANCTGVVRLAHGTITFAFANEPPPRKILAITGGTGKYRTARGDGFVVESGTNSSGTFSLRIIDED
jgi:hypothetical protein